MISIIIGLMFDVIHIDKTDASELIQFLLELAAVSRSAIRSPHIILCDMKSS